MTAYAVNSPKELESRRKELRSRLRNDSSTAQRKWTPEEMRAAAQRLVSSVLTTGKLPPKAIQ